MAGPPIARAFGARRAGALPLTPGARPVRTRAHTPRRPGAPGLPATDPIGPGPREDFR